MYISICMLKLYSNIFKQVHSVIKLSSDETEIKIDRRNSEKLKLFFINHFSSFKNKKKI